MKDWPCFSKKTMTLLICLPVAGKSYPWRLQAVWLGSFGAGRGCSCPFLMTFCDCQGLADIFSHWTDASTPNAFSNLKLTRLTCGLVFSAQVDIICTERLDFYCRNLWETIHKIPVNNHKRRQLRLQRLCFLHLHLPFDLTAPGRRCHGIAGLLC